MSMMKETDPTRLRIAVSRVLEAFLDRRVDGPKAVADLVHFCRPDLCHLNGPGIETRLADTLALAATGEIGPDFALTHLVRLATAHVLCVESSYAFG
ncbi:hypothetical protein [Asticcacaulis benevestitus]|uniref:Uncharacterized protein n=1 Tax=Asticcacaulis benevestitus DSM 16100 = ATCC BAA-896 TaxID=1121022 RepID=V4P0J2_9CAUL|nr:hypothetical protein [Asticcacaulis benevestitus]ESQ80719.1 hypothetical protein ABENE_22255 [Asticcacaulis benevestitus DSM 16100 = ATCC BAA-896]